MKKSRAIVVRPEVLPVPLQAPSKQTDIERLIEQKLAEMTSGNRDAVFEPWFRSKAVAAAIKRIQTVIEQQKWPRYFAKWGCIVCGTTAEGHSNLGMCWNCHVRITMRLRAILKEAEAEQKPHSIPTDLQDKANAALRGKR